jgi:hypothetical protein
MTRFARSVRHNIVVPLRGTLTLVAGAGTVINYRDATTSTGPDSVVGPDHSVVIFHPAPRHWILTAHGDNATFDVSVDANPVPPS